MAYLCCPLKRKITVYIFPVYVALWLFNKMLMLNLFQTYKQMIVDKTGFY